MEDWVKENLNYILLGRGLKPRRLSKNSHFGNSCAVSLSWQHTPVGINLSVTPESFTFPAELKNDASSSYDVFNESIRVENEYVNLRYIVQKAGELSSYSHNYEADIYNDSLYESIHIYEGYFLNVQPFIKNGYMAKFGAPRIVLEGEVLQYVMERIKGSYYSFLISDVYSQQLESLFLDTFKGSLVYKSQAFSNRIHVEHTTPYLHFYIFKV